MLHELMYAVRLLRRSPGFAVVAVLTLALGIGAGTAVFSIVNALLLRPLPYRDAGRLVTLWNQEVVVRPIISGQQAGTWKRRRPGWYQVAGPDYLDLRARSRAFSGIAATDEIVRLAALTGGGGEPLQVSTRRVSANFFEVLGVRPALGQGFSSEQDTRTVVLSWALWRQRFGGNPGIVGKAITLDGESHAVVGVMPASVGFPEGDVWIPLALASPYPRGAGGCELTYRCLNFRLLARLAPGVSRAQAEEELRARTAQRAQQFPRERGRALVLLPLAEDIVGDTAKPVLVLLGAVGLLLLIACANVANLLLMRAAGRRRELAVRAALGAGRRRLLRQMLLESLAVWLPGGAAGVLLAAWNLDALARILPQDIPRMEGLAIDWRVLLLSATASLATCVLFGLLPATPLSRPRLQDWLKENPARSGGGDRHRLRSALVTGEIALALVLLAGAGLLLNTFVHLWSVRLGFSPENLLIARVRLPINKQRDQVRAEAFYRELVARLETAPGILGAAFSMPLPCTGDRHTQGVSFDGSEEEFSANIRDVTPSYFRTMRIPLLRGRTFDARDGERVMIVNETAARQLWPGQDPIGKRILFRHCSSCPAREVVGVVGDTRQALEREAGIEFYRPSFQMWGGFNAARLVLRTQDNPLHAVPVLRAQVQALDRDQPIDQLQTMDQVLSNSVAGWRFPLLLLGFFGVTSLVLAAVGIYGVMSYAVTQRRHEIGIRMALGAARGDVLVMMVREGLRMAAAGLLLGLAGALAATRVLSAYLFGVRAADPLTFASVSLLLALVALVACYLPARRAASADPIAALRHE